MNTLLIRRIRGPVFLLCFALTAILAQWHVLSFAQSWPLYLLTAGFLRLAEAVAAPAAYGVAAGAVYSPGGFRRPSITGALALLLVGTLALLLTADVLPLGSFWHVFSLWWPLLLVLIGVLLLVERVWERGVEGRYAAAGVPVGRRRGGGLAFLVITLVILGLLSHALPFSVGDANSWSPDWNWSFGGQTYENEVHLQQPIAPDAALTIDNAHGDLQIAPSTDGLIHVDAHQEAHVREGRKERAFADTKPVLTVYGASASVSVPGRDGVTVRLVLLVPEGVMCTVRNHHGDIAVSGLRRALDIKQDHGDVALDSLGGPVHLDMDHGDVHAHSLGGVLTIDGRADDVALSDVKGSTVLRGEFFGDTVVNGAGGAVQFHSRRTDLEAGRITGELSLDGDDLHMSGVSGGLKLTSRSKNIEVTGLSGNAEISDSNGDVSVAAAAPVGTVSLTNNTGNITVAVPAGAALAVDASTGKDNTIDSEFALAQTTDGDRRTLRGQVGQGGPRWEIKTDHGDLTLRRSAAGDTAKGSGLNNVPENVPGKEPERHLRSKGEPPTPVVQ